MSYLEVIDPGNSGGSVRIPELPPIRLAPIVYRCSVCDGKFLSQDDLFNHRFESHPFRRPSLVLRGKEITSPREIIVNQLSANDIAFADANLFKLNGNYYTKQQFVEKISKQTYGVFEISLANHGVETSYELQFDIPDSVEIAEVERLFFSLLGKEVVDISRIDAFIDVAENYRSASRYMDGLTQYLYGLLAKDQRGGIHLAQYEYREKLNMALDILKIFETPLALVICGIINFNQNIFAYSQPLSSAPKLKQVMNRFSCFIRSEKYEPSFIHMVSSPSSVPLDATTDRVLEWGMMDWDELCSYRKEIELAINSPTWVADDRFKAQILLTEMFVSLGDFDAAKTIARKVVNDAIFGDWARRVMDRSS